MILNALHDYYQRRLADPDPARRLPAFGRELKEIGFVLELDTDGSLVAISDRRTLDAKKRLVGTPYLVPKGVKKTSGVAANLLWDNAEYVLQVPDAKKLAAAAEKGKADDYKARLVEMQAAFRARVQALPAPALADPGIQAVLAFLSTDTLAAATSFTAYADIASSPAALSFRLVGDDELVCQRPTVSPWLVEAGDDDAGDLPEDAGTSTCLITGQQAPVARLHTAIKGVWGAQSAGANIVSFNLDAFNSFGKAQGTNAPVSQAAAFAYTTALNALLAKGSNQRLQIGDASTVFWAQRADPVEDWLAQIMGGDDPGAHVQQVKALFEAAHRGGFDGGRGENRFFMLGLAPNAARVAIRFWHQAPLSDLARQIVAWFDDLSIARAPHDPEFPSLFRLLSAIALQGKADNVPPKLAGDIVRAILTGGAFPVTWLNAAVQRCRAEQQVTHLRAASIKACLNRFIRARNLQEEEFTAMLDVAHPSPAYRLGRLFAVLEKIQEESSGGRLNSTIRDRYYGAASSTPASVVPLLLKLKNHHVGKLDERGRAMLYRAFQDHQPDDYIGQVLWGLGDVPRQLGLPEQGRFALGYYHQRQAFFTKTAAPATTDTVQGGH